MRRPARPEIVGAVALFLLAPAVYVEALLPGRMPISFDTVAYFYPLRHYLSESWRQGRWLPLWIPDVFLGVPFFANLQNAVLYPPTVIFALLPTDQAMAWLMVLHVGLAGAGMFAYAYRCLRLRAPGSAVAAIVYMLSPYLTAHLTHLNQNNTLGWTPWLMFVVDRTVAKPRPRMIAATGLVVAVTFLAGHTQQMYFTLLLALAAGGIRLFARWGGDRRQLLASVAAAAGGVALGLGLVAVQLLPTLELVARSTRSAGLDLATAGFLSLPLKGAMGSVLPKYSIELPTEYAGASVGAASLALMSLALVLRGRRRVVIFWAVVFVVAIVAATGPNGRLYDVFFYSVPGLRLFRVPSRLLIFSTVAGALLAGYGVRSASQLISAAGRGGRWRARSEVLMARGAGLAALPILAVLIDRALGAHLPRALRFLPHEIGNQDLILLAAFEGAALLIVLGAAWIPNRGAHAAGALLVSLVLGDILLATGSISSRHPLPVAVLHRPPAAASLLPRGPNARYLSLLRPSADPAFDAELSGGAAVGDRSRYRELRDLAQVLRPNTALGAGAMTPDGYDGGILPLTAWVQFRRPVLGAAARAPADYTIHDLIDRVKDVQWLRDTGVGVVFVDAGTYPAVQACNCFTQLERVGNAVAWAVDGNVSRAWVEGPSGRRAAEITVDSGERVEIRMPDAMGGRLVLADTFYPGWAATVDGRPVTISVYQGLLRSVDVPRGAQTIVYRYRPTSLTLGAIITVMAGVLAIGLLLVPARRKRAMRPARRDDVA